MQGGKNATTASKEDRDSWISLPGTFLVFGAALPRMGEGLTVAVIFGWQPGLLAGQKNGILTSADGESRPSPANKAFLLQA